MDQILRGNPREVVHTPFPKLDGIKGQIVYLLNFAVLAPSTHNCQPWNFEINENVCTFLLDTSIKLPEADPTGRDSYISMGLCIEFFVLAAKAHGFLCTIVYEEKESNVVAKVTLGERDDSTKLPIELLDTIRTRVNVRGLFKPELLPAAVTQNILQVNEVAELEGVSLHLVDKKEQLHILAALTASGVQEARESKAFRIEFMEWFHNNLSKKKNGIFGYSVLMNTPVSIIMPFFMKRLTLKKLLGKVNYKSVASAACACVFTSEKDNKHAWVKTGQMAANTMLSLYGSGVTTSTYVASIEIGDRYKSVQKMLGTNERPQFLFVAGYSDVKIPPTPRQPLIEKLK